MNRDKLTFPGNRPLSARFSREKIKSRVIVILLAIIYQSEIAICDNSIRPAKEHRNVLAFIHAGQLIPEFIFLF